MIEELLNNEQKAHPVWQSWVAHVDYFLELMQVSFTDASLSVLEAKIVRAHKLFQAVPEFDKLWTPKHHFSLHFVEDIRRFGPLRHVWCMRFESKNQEHKRAARTGNYRDAAGD